MAVVRLKPLYVCLCSAVGGPSSPQIEGVKEKLYTHTGTKPCHQKLILKNSQGDAVRVADTRPGSASGYV